MMKKNTDAFPGGMVRPGFNKEPGMDAYIGTKMVRAKEMTVDLTGSKQPVNEITDTVMVHLCPVCKQLHTSKGAAEACLKRCREALARHAEASRQWRERYERAKASAIKAGQECKAAQLLLRHGFESEAKLVLDKYPAFWEINMIGCSQTQTELCNIALEECRRCAKGDEHE